ncbi:hypothetical protein SAMN06265222_105105 [Neorhodopirellula lusitana]|uniref:Uncharacterized protein n=1 Tax=Neorhodopirellula lusitana TaxID=445327 RepID=A0ABY1Q1B5_9BACT|nr:hypothetical protein SAMN06265222_105105 [Neorhodopirellula lusitana]
MEVDSIVLLLKAHALSLPSARAVTFLVAVSLRWSLNSIPAQRSTDQYQLIAHLSRLPMSSPAKIAQGTK